MTTLEHGTNLFQMNSPLLVLINRTTETAVLWLYQECNHLRTMRQRASFSQDLCVQTHSMQFNPFTGQTFSNSNGLSIKLMGIAIGLAEWLATDCAVTFALRVDWSSDKHVTREFLNIWLMYLVELNLESRCTTFTRNIQLLMISLTIMIMKDRYHLLYLHFML